MVSFTFLSITTVIYAVLFLLGTIGNVLVITVIYKHKEMRSSTNYFLVNLSLADLLVLLICMPVSLSEMYLGEYFPFGRIMCEFISFIFSSAFLSPSVFH
ncbi:Neuropeptide SIFamide receptor [Holothuria leucospilota]|uniref:Neuropeptide SIFamide receptor n=1 Tax=Holothuria leucospilota TaxID=206669 RepID=A0A9Q0YR39_HOLLE|nr:Neuropeptide SIFamide receptor [Holothuria leucospilota]